MGDVVDAGALGELARSVESGNLRLEEGTAERCVEACNALITELAEVDDQLGYRQWRPQFGAFAAGEELADKFEQLAVGPDGSLRVALRSHIEAVTKMRDLFEAAGRAYREAEEANAARLAAAGGSQ
ncbi:hypothetical protein [Rhodococcus gannanensis]|uniref:PE domain-containing protein n=1 Tax=Rhodococcus gannanensis TaxID=1960308 RepID=A0ABW4P1S2_9NOCA